MFDFILPYFTQSVPLQAASRLFPSQGHDDSLEGHLIYRGLAMRRSRGLQAIIDERQRAMNDLVIRASAVAILHELRAFSDDEKLSLIHTALTAGAGIEYDLAGLRILKPDAPEGREIEW